MQPDKLLEAIATQVPNLVVLAFIVSVFVKHMNRTNATFREINRENLEAREQSRIVIEENTRAVTKNTDVLVDITRAVEFLKHQSKNDPATH